jgi:hypothetical protein
LFTSGGMSFARPLTNGLDHRNGGRNEAVIEQLIELLVTGRSAAFRVYKRINAWGEVRNFWQELSSLIHRNI